MMSIMSSLLFSGVLSIPGKAAATRRNSCFTLYPVFALVSINITFSSLALCSPSSVVICLFHIISCFSTGFNIHHIQFLGFSLTLLYRNLSLVCQISFVPHQHDDDVASPLCPNIINPLGGLLEGIQVCNVIDYHSNSGVADVAGNETAEPLLACCVPELQPNL